MPPRCRTLLQKKPLTRKERDELLKNKLQLVIQAVKQNRTDTSQVEVQVRQGELVQVGYASWLGPPEASWGCTICVHAQQATLPEACSLQVFPLPTQLSSCRLQSDVVEEAPEAKLWAGYGDLAVTGAPRASLVGPQVVQLQVSSMWR